MHERIKECHIETMVEVPAAEFQRNIGRYQDMALSQPVAVTRNGRESTGADLDR
jgi:hypothetical protein